MSCLEYVFLCAATHVLAQLPGQAQTPVGAPAEARGDRGGQRESTNQPTLVELSEEVRQLKAQVDELRRQNKAIADHVVYAPGLEVQDEDYAQARSRFKTTLIRKGPSPQRSSNISPSAGVSEVEYASGELRLKGWMNRPSDESARRPAVLFLHGGFAFGKGDWEQTKPYRDAGFVVFAPILRAENGQPGAFSYFYDEVDDVLAAAEFLSRQPYVDSKRLFLAGHSIGGTMTLLAALASNRFRAAASFDGFPYWGPFTDEPNLPFDKSDPREIQLRSPIAYAGSLKCPLRIYHQARERHPLAEYLGLVCRRMVVLAKYRGLDVEEVEIEGDHMTMVPPAIRQSIAFFRRVSVEEIVPWRGESSPLPKSHDLDLGGGVAIKLVRIEAGKFQMGSPKDEKGRKDDETQHEAEISKPFAMSVHPVTQAQFERVMGTSPSRHSAQGNDKSKVTGIDTDDFPVENVSWEDAVDFCHIVSLQTNVRDKGWIVDLPTEAEWEYACRAGTETVFHYGDSLSSQQANFSGSGPYGGAERGPSLRRPSKVGSYSPNAWGLYDMHGNVLQWCKDVYDANYGVDDSAASSDRVARGGFFRAPGADCRAARRFHFPPALRSSPTRGAPPIGFRVVLRQREQ